MIEYIIGYLLWFIWGQFTGIIMYKLFFQKPYCKECERQHLLEDLTGGK